MDFLDEEQPKKDKRPFIIGSGLAILVLAGIGYFGFRYRQAQKLLANPTEAAKKEQAEIVKKVQSLVVVPDGEEPTVATIADIDKLKDKPFFTMAENGDKVLVYANAKKAILYRPSTNRVVEMSPLNPQAVQPTPGPTTVPVVAGETTEVKPTPTQALQGPSTVTVLNGTRIAGLAGKTQEFIEGKSGDFEVVSAANAQGRDYEKTVVVDVSGKNADAAGTLASLLSATVDKKPTGEISPSSDLLVIVGTDFQP